MLCNIYSANDLNCKACMVVVVKVKILSLLEKVLTVMYFCFMLWLVLWLTLSNLFNAIYSSPWKAPAYIFNIKYISDLTDLPLTIDTHPYLKNKEIINKHRHLKEHTHTYTHNIWHTHILTIARHSLKMQQVFRFLFSESESDSKTVRSSKTVRNFQIRFAFIEVPTKTRLWKAARNLLSPKNLYEEVYDKQTILARWLTNLIVSSPAARTLNVAIRNPNIRMTPCSHVVEADADLEKVVRIGLRRARNTSMVYWRV